MKKYLALLLSMLLLVGCARIEPEQGGTKPEPGQPDDVSAKLLSQYALAEVKLPELPAEPSEEELSKSEAIADLLPYSLSFSPQ